MSIVYLNGDFLPLEKASVSPLDRGFIFGDGVYEVIPVYGGKLFRLEEHLQRLDNSLASLRIKQPLTHPQWEEAIKGLVSRNGNGDLSLYLQITRGVAKRDHAFPADVSPTVFMMTSPLLPMAEAVRTTGVKAITLEDIRWKYCHIKAIALLPNILLRQQAIDMGATEAILIRDGNITEGAASNIFMIKDNKILTPPKGPFLLPGITRDLIIELAVKHHITALEQNITPQDLLDADEIWLTSSTREILAVTELDSRPVGNGKPGELWEKMMDYYQAYKQSIRENNEIAC